MKKSHSSRKADQAATKGIYPAISGKRNNLLPLDSTVRKGNCGGCNVAFLVLRTSTLSVCTNWRP